MEIRAAKFYDALKKNNAPTIQITDSYGREKIVFDPIHKNEYFDKSDETGRKIRWGVVLSNNQKVSMDGLLRVTEPEVWLRYSKRLKGKKIAEKNEFIIRHTLDEKEFDELLQETFDFLRSQDVFSETYRGRDFEGNKIITTDINNSKVNKLLSEEGHPLAELFNRELILKDGTKVIPYQRYLWEEHVKENSMALGGTIAEQVEEKLVKQQINKEFKDIGRVAQTRKEKSAYKLISGSILSTLEEDGVMAYNMVKKENVWPEINVQEEKDRGVSSGAAYLKVKLREALPTRPKDEKAKRATYVLFLELFQKDLKECYTVEQIKALVERYKTLPMNEVIGYFINPDFLTADENRKKEIQDSLERNHRFKATSFYGSRYLVPKLINEIFGAKFENALFRGSDAGKMLWIESYKKEPITPEESASAILNLQERKAKFVVANEELKDKYIKKNVTELLLAMERDWSLHGDSKKLYKKEPEKFREWVIQYYDRRIRNEVSRWDEKEKELQPKGNDWSWTEVKAKTEPSKEKSESINTKTPLAYIKRTGGYKVDVNTPTEIVDKFGFSAVNYGVYVDDTWSKEHTKHFLGAMLDLGDILDIDIKSFNDLGKLSIAFGAKGRRGHMATYFPQTKDINLTRGNGDGSLAHEWGHYFDNVIVELSEKLAKNSFASDGGSRDYEIKSLFQELMTFIYKGDPAFTPKLPTTFFAKPADTAPAYSTRVNGNYETKAIEIKPTIEETLEQLDNFAVIDKGIYNTQLRLFGYVIAQFGLEKYQVPMRLKTSYYFHKSAYGMFQYCYPTLKGIDTFVIARTKYWSSAVELFARAWETVVLKKLMDNDRMSNYLVADIPMEDLVSESYNRPYPSGLELARIEILIEKIIKAVKAKYNLPGFIPPSEIKEDEYLDLSGNGKVEAGVVVDTDTVTGEEEVDFVGAIATLEFLIESGGSPEETEEWKDAIDTLKFLS